MIYNSMDDISSAFMQTYEIEKESMWLQGNIILEASTQGWDIDELCAYCGSLVKRSKRTIYRRYATTRTFGKLNPALPYEFHAICADLVDYRSADADVIATQQQNAHDWLQRALDEDLSTRALRAAIQAAGGRVDVKPTVYADGALAMIVEDQGAHYLRLYVLDADFDPKQLKPGMEVNVTLVQATAQEKELAK